MNYWIEKTYSSERSLDKEMQFKKVLLSPLQDKLNRDIYKNMRLVKKNDIVLHLDQSIDQIIGYSVVESEYSEKSFDGMQYYQVKLRDFIPYVPTINIREFFYDPKHAKSLGDVMLNNVVFYRKYQNSFALKQGAYLTQIPPLLYSILEGYIKRSKNTKTQVVREIPEHLARFFGNTIDISIIIGENGTGKSKLLSDLAFKYLEKDQMNTIAISSSIFDRFSNIRKNLKKDKGNNFKFLGASNGPKVIENVFKDFLNLEDKIDINNDKLKIMEKLLEYLGYEKKIGVRFNLNSFNSKRKNKYNEIDFLYKEVQKLNSLIDDGNKIFWFSLSNNNENDIVISNIQKINKLSKKVMDSNFDDKMEMDFYLTKEDLDLPLLYASSGQLMLLVTMIYIASNITKQTVILIDEPENSLHLQWQKEFIKLLSDLFKDFSPKIIIATHSPLLISRAQFMDKNIYIYVAKPEVFELQSNVPNNYEFLLLTLFNIITPQNRSLSEHLVNLLNQLGSQEITYDQFCQEVNSYKKLVYDERQRVLFDDILGLADEIQK